MISTVFAFLSVFRMVVIPVQFQDQSFTCTEQELAETVAEAQDYFNRQLGGSCTFTFDMAPTVTLSNEISYYGSNYSGRYDALFYEAVREACNLSSTLDFSLYDNDGDGYVDNVCIIAAGLSEADGTDAYYIWPQHSYLSYYSTTFRLNGKIIDSYSVSCEFTSDAGENPRIAGIGFMCHEIAHSFGLVDLYDTDQEGSGGISPGLYKTSLMDFGCKNNDGNSPPNLSAVDYDILGEGTCTTIEVGEYTLGPINTSMQYLKAETGTDGEYFLFECRAPGEFEGSDGGLVIYHIDKSDNSAGYSDYYRRTLTAAERWTYNQINARPDRMCVELLPADSEGLDMSGICFPYNGKDCFGSDTNPAFRTWDGSSTGLVLLNIRRNSDCSVSFNVVEPIVLEDVEVFQDAAIIYWTIDSLVTDNLGFEINCTDGENTFSFTADSDERCFTIEGLSPRTTYNYTVSLKFSEDDIFSATSSFTTKVYLSGTYPYIYLTEKNRNEDGTFMSGAKIPLRVYNATGVAEVRWYLNGVRIRTGSDGYYTITAAGTLKAEIIYEDGTSEVIIKEITL